MRGFSLVFFIVLLNLDKTTDSSVLKFIPILSLLAYVTVNVIVSPKVRKINFPIVFYLLILIVFIGILRNGDPNSSLFSAVNRMLVYLFTIIAFIQALSIGIKQQLSAQTMFVWSFLIPLLGLVLINLVGYAAGMRSIVTEGTELGEAVFLGELGISMQRASFPFSTGFNNYSVVVGELLLFSLFGFRYFKEFRILMLISIVFAVVSILLVDTRSALIYPFLIFLLLSIVLKNIRSPRILWVIPFLIIFGPFLLVTVLGILVDIPSLAFLSRNSHDFETANSRTLIWLGASIEFLEFKLIHLIGYGEFGHFSSGASKSWSYIFSSWEGDSSLLVTPHSSFYATLYDYGYLGLLILIIFQLIQLKFIRKHWMDQSGLFIVLAAFLIYWNLVGVVETFIGFYVPNSMILFTMIGIYGLRITKLIEGNQFTLDTHQIRGNKLNEIVH
jgi:hypothetical protein